MVDGVVAKISMVPRMNSPLAEAFGEMSRLIVVEANVDVERLTTEVVEEGDRWWPGGALWPWAPE